MITSFEFWVDVVVLRLGRLVLILLCQFHHVMVTNSGLDALSHTLFLSNVADKSRNPPLLLLRVIQFSFGAPFFVSFMKCGQFDYPLILVDFGSVCLILVELISLVH